MVKVCIAESDFLRMPLLQIAYGYTFLVNIRSQGFWQQFLDKSEANHMLMRGLDIFEKNNYMSEKQ